MLEIKDLFNEELAYWRKKNISLFGVECIDYFYTSSEIQEILDDSCDKYWNSDNPCKLAKALFIEDGINKDADKLIRNTFKLKINTFSFCIDVFGKFKTKGDPSFLKICSIPTPTNQLSWLIDNIHYTPRVTAIRDFNSIVAKINKNKISGENWNYFIDQDKFIDHFTKQEMSEEDVFNHGLSARSKLLLNAVLGKEELTLDNFKKALKKVPKFKSNSILSFKFARFEYFEDLILNTYKYTNPLKKNILGINKLISAKAKQYTKTKELQEGAVVITNSKIEALENFRTVVNIYSADYKPKFSFTDSLGIFDSFKTATTGDAGRVRLLLDNVVVKDGALWVVDENGNEKDMFSLYKNPQAARLSCISSSLFCGNNKPKRLMMTAKLSSQAVPLKDEIDDVTHRTLARVCFADLSGYSFGDSIIISESFARKLNTREKRWILVSPHDDVAQKLEKEFNHDNNYYLSEYEIYYLLGELNHERFFSGEITDCNILKIDKLNKKKIRLLIEYSIPFTPGCKVSNLHGAKGVVSKILPDNEMPNLIKQAGNMEPGPIDIIISGFSTIRRGSLGQLFEAWALANDIKLNPGEDLIANVSEKYKKELKEFNDNSIIEFNGVKSIKPIGMINIIRLYHHPFIHSSFSVASGIINPSKMLKLGEMEKLGLLANGCDEILKELSIRSCHRHQNPEELIKELYENRELSKNAKIDLTFLQLINSFGYKIEIEEKLNKKILKIKKLNISESAANEVTTSKLLRPRKVFTEDNELDFHDLGIFSNKIFGKFGSCRCGKLLQEGVCKECGTRVINRNNMPIFYTKFYNTRLPYSTLNFDNSYLKYKKEIEKILKFKGFMYKNKFYDFDMSILDLSSFDEDKLKIGYEALECLGVSKEWYLENTFDKLPIPHTSYRPITVTNSGKYFLGDINTSLISLIRAKNKLESFKVSKDSSIFLKIALGNELNNYIEDYFDSIINVMLRNKKSIMSTEIRGNALTGAARAVVINNYALDEDTAIIGYNYISTLFPQLYKKYTTEEGYTDLVGINNAIKREGYKILVNRQPSIGEKSILAYIPQFSLEDSERNLLQINPISTDGLAGDFDGDVFLMIALYSYKACKESEKLLPSRNYLGNMNLEIRNKIFEDLEYIIEYKK